MGSVLRGIVRNDLWFHIHFWILCSSSVKNSMGILIGITLNQEIALSGMDMLMILILLIHDLDICLHLYQYVSISVSFWSVLQFLCTDFLPCWLNLFLGIIYFDAAVNGIGYFFFSLPL